VRMGEMFVLRKWFLAKKKSCKCLKPCQRRKGSAGRRCGCSRCGLAGSPSVPLRFQPALRAPDRAGVRTRPGRSSQTHTGRPNRSYLFCSNQSQRSRVTSYQREVSGQVTGRLSVPYQSSFGELRMGPRLRDTLDTGLCCSSQGRGQLSQVIYKQGHVDINLQSTAPSRLGSLCCITVVPFRPAHQTGDTGWVSHQFGSTNVFPDAW